MKKISAQELRKVILSEVRRLKLRQAERRTVMREVAYLPHRKTKSSLFSRTILTEEFAAVDTGTNIADLSGKDAYEQLTSGDEEAPLIQAMMAATGWASGAIGKAGGVEAIKNWAESVGEAELGRKSAEKYGFRV